MIVVLTMSEITEMAKELGVNHTTKCAISVARYNAPDSVRMRMMKRRWSVPVLAFEARATR